MVRDEVASLAVFGDRVSSSRQCSRPLLARLQPIQDFLSLLGLGTDDIDDSSAATVSLCIIVPTPRRLNKSPKLHGLCGVIYTVSTGWGSEQKLRESSFRRGLGRKADCKVL